MEKNTVCDLQMFYWDFNNKQWNNIWKEMYKTLTTCAAHEQTKCTSVEQEKHSVIIWSIVRALWLILDFKYRLNQKLFSEGDTTMQVSTAGAGNRLTDLTGIRVGGHQRWKTKIFQFMNIHRKHLASGCDITKWHYWRNSQTIRPETTQPTGRENKGKR